MSYDFRMFRAKPNEDPLVTGQSDSEPTRGPRDPAKEALKKKTTEALKAYNPALEVFKFEYDKIAEFQKTTIEEAMERHRHLELNDLESGKGIQITLFDDEASVTVPYWHKGDKAKAVFDEIGNYMAIISRENCYVIYDPQLDQILDSSGAVNESLAVYTGAAKRIHKKFGLDTDNKTKPWWRFWQ